MSNIKKSAIKVNGQQAYHFKGKLVIMEDKESHLLARMCKYDTVRGHWQVLDNRPYKLSRGQFLKKLTPSEQINYFNNKYDTNFRSVSEMRASWDLINKGWLPQEELAKLGEGDDMFDLYYSIPASSFSEAIPSPMDEEEFSRWYKAIMHLQDCVC